MQAKHTMRAMVMSRAGTPLQLTELPRPDVGPGQVLIQVGACGVCRTDLHVLDGDLGEPRLPLILGHEIVGRVVALGAGVTTFAVGERVGVPWLASTCGDCAYCRRGRENLCDAAEFTGYTVNGGYAEFALADSRYCFPVAGGSTDGAVAPLLCAGLIGYRSWRMCGPAERLGIMGFGAAAHIVAQVASHDGQQVYAFTRPGDATAQAFARRLGAVWAGGSDQKPPEQLDAVIIFAPVGALVPAALRLVRKGGTVVCGGIHMSRIPPIDYADLWGERRICSVANLTRRDAEEFLALAPTIPIQTEVQLFPLEAANEALSNLREGRLTGAAVLDCQAQG
jgi:propanol-preferring alcohol dehydrogenase